MSRDQQRAMQDFVVEAEELLEALAEDLDQAEVSFEQKGRVRPDLVNKIFREMHSLKGLASMLGLKHVTDLAHDLEDMLDKLRMGKVTLGRGLFQLLQEAQGLLRDLVKAVSRGESDAGVDISRMTTRIYNLLNAKPAEEDVNPIESVGLDEQTLKSLTEYEEHRLIENIRDAARLFAIKVGFDFSDFDTRLRELSDKLNGDGEIISTLPVVDSDPTAGIFFRLIYGTQMDEAAVTALVDGTGATVERLGMKPDGPGGGAAPAPKPARSAKEGPAPAAEEKPAAPAPDSGIDEAVSELTRSMSNTVRVDITKLDGVMSIVGELAIYKSRVSEISKELFASVGFTQSAVELSKSARLIEKKLNELQRSVIDIRMVPIGQVYAKLGRTGRKIARETGKRMNLVFFGEDTELDKMMVEEIGNPLLHIIRNSMDHGLEGPEERRKAGKPEEGTVTLSAFQRGNSVVIQVKDDGRGIDHERIQKAALKRGLITETQTLSREDAFDLMFQPGFSSAEKVSEISGRGVGLDVVKRTITDLKGSIHVWSEPGQGTTFEIVLPITLAIIQSLVVECAGETYAIPLSSTQETFLLQEGDIQSLNRREVYYLRGATLPLIRLDRVFGLRRGEALPADHRHFVIVTTVGDKTAGLMVDRLRGEQEVVIKPVGQRLGHLAGIAGATELGENRCVLVVDTMSLLATVREDRAAS